MNFSVVIDIKESPIIVFNRIANSIDELTETIRKECKEQSTDWNEIFIYDMDNKITRIISKDPNHLIISFKNKKSKIKNYGIAKHK